MKHLLLGLLLLCTTQSAAASAQPAVIRVAVVRGTRSLKLKTSEKLFVTELKTGERYQLLPKAQYEIRPSGASISVAGQQLSSPVKLLTAKTGDRMRLGGHLYRGDIVLVNSGGGKLDIIEALSIEDYLCGVLPEEMSADWPLEALKAQAVASRTYALKQINPALDYDITNGVETQVYKGSAAPAKRVLEAVNATKGEVLKYKGKLVTAFFHACCGGHTASVSSAWGEDQIKPLGGVSDPYCKPSTHYSWQLIIPARDMLNFVQQQGSAALRIKSLKVYKRDRNGRAMSLRFTTDQGALEVLTKDLRKQFGTFDFRSTYITDISLAKNGYRFSGRGWGHGVGMCQDGAKFMAIGGKNYRKILKHYYPGASIEALDD